MIKHWLFGELNYTKEISIETDCSECVHKRVCNRDMKERCINWEFGITKYSSSNCGSCSYCLVRFHNTEPIPCFCCRDFLSKGE